MSQSTDSHEHESPDIMVLNSASHGGIEIGAHRNSTRPPMVLSTGRSSGIDAPPSTLKDLPSTVDNPISVDCDDGNDQSEILSANSASINAADSRDILTVNPSGLLSVNTTTTTTFDGIIRRMDLYKNKLAASNSRSSLSSSGEGDADMVNLIEKLTTAAADVDTVAGSITDDESIMNNK